jgi:hypothetical protein
MEKCFRSAYPPLLAVLLAIACVVAACGVVTPASGPPTYGDGRGDSRA